MINDTKVTISGRQMYTTLILSSDMLLELVCRRRVKTENSRIYLICRNVQTYCNMDNFGFTCSGKYCLIVDILFNRKVKCVG